MTEQHSENHREAQTRDQKNSPVAGRTQVRGERCRAGHIGLHSQRRRCPVHNGPYRLDGLIRRRPLPGISKGYLHICGFAIKALRSGLRHLVAPEILDVLHMRRVGFQLTNQFVVVAMRIVAQRLLPLQDDHRHHAGVGLTEQLAHPLRCLK